MGQVYVITNTVNGMQYVGQSMKSGASRFKSFVKASWRGSNHILCKDMRKYDWKNFKVEILEEQPDRRSLLIREFFWIGELNTIYPNGYNKIRTLPGKQEPRRPRPTSRVKKVRTSKDKKVKVRKVREEKVIDARHIDYSSKPVIVNKKVFNDLNSPELILELIKLGNDWWGSLTPKERVQYRWRLEADLHEHYTQEEKEVMNTGIKVQI